MKDGAVYEDLMDFKALKKCMEDQLEDYNMEPGVIAMDLVLFRDAIEHGMLNLLGGLIVGYHTYRFLHCSSLLCKLVLINKLIEIFGSFLGGTYGSLNRLVLILCLLHKCQPLSSR